jgi:hypothetical protein
LADDGRLKKSDPSHGAACGFLASGEGAIRHRVFHYSSGWTDAERSLEGCLRQVISEGEGLPQ